MENGGIIRVMWNILFFKSCKAVMEEKIIVILEPTTKNTQIAVAWFFQTIEYMVTGFINIKPVSRRPRLCHEIVST